MEGKSKDLCLTRFSRTKRQKPFLRVVFLKKRQMLLLFYYSLTVVPLVSNNIFKGMEDLDQELEDDIIPGGDVAIGTFPYIAAVFNALRKFQTCSASIINEKFVLTAGYCVSKDDEIVKPVYVSVLAGVVDMRDHDLDEWRYAERIITSNQTYSNMKILALIKVNTPFFINYSTKTISVHNGLQLQNSFCKAVTWRFHDRLNRVSLKSLVLKQYAVYVLNQTACEKSYADNPMIAGLKGINFVCVNFVAVLESFRNLDCVGVDGSMIFCENDGVMVPTGIATRFVGGSMCNRANILYTYFDFGAHYQWIQKEINGTSNLTRT